MFWQILTIACLEVCSSAPMHVALPVPNRPLLSHRDGDFMLVVEDKFSRVRSFTQKKAGEHLQHPNASFTFADRHLKVAKLRLAGIKNDFDCRYNFSIRRDWQDGFIRKACMDKVALKSRNLGSAPPVLSNSFDDYNNYLCFLWLTGDGSSGVKIGVFASNIINRERGKIGIKVGDVGQGYKEIKDISNGCRDVAISGALITIVISDINEGVVIKSSLGEEIIDIGVVNIAIIAEEKKREFYSGVALYLFSDLFSKKDQMFLFL